MAITTEQVKELREKTGISIMQCRKALEEAGGDIEKAAVILRKQAGAAMAKKSDRELGAGSVQAYIHNNEVGAMVMLSSETDFVAKNEEFAQLAREIAMQVAATDPKFVTREEVGEKEMEKAREVFAEEVKDKPAEIQEKILSGKLDAYFKDQILLEQPHIKDPEKTIKDLIEAATHKFGERIEISQFTRYSVR